MSKTFPSFGSYRAGSQSNVLATNELPHTNSKDDLTNFNKDLKPPLLS
jgi:hypothetical protein